jgi:hypothetical protein
MRTIAALIALTICAVLAACGTPTATITGNDGTKQQYSRYYDAGDWLEEGKLGLTVVLDHEMTSGANAPEATGKVTLYLLNLDSTPVTVRSLIVSTPQQQQSLASAQSAVAKMRSRTRVNFGKVPLPNNATEVRLFVQYQLEGADKIVKEFVVKRRTPDELTLYFSGRGVPPPYPWFRAPYYPFSPPLMSTE